MAKRVTDCGGEKIPKFPPMIQEGKKKKTTKKKPKKEG